MSTSHESGPLIVTNGIVANVTGNVVGSVVQGSAAIVAGTTQTRAGATAITTSMVSVTVGNASDGVVLPAAVVGTTITIVNVSNAAGKIYAAGSDTVNLVAGATGVALASGSTTGSVTLAVCASAASWTLK
jgi:hypothetical protein